MVQFSSKRSTLQPELFNAALALCVCRALSNVVFSLILATFCRNLNLKGFDFTNAICASEGANFTHADCEGANFQGCSLLARAASGQEPRICISATSLAPGLRPPSFVRAARAERLVLLLALYQ